MLDSLRTRRGDACLSDLRLDQISLGEPASTEERAHLAVCERCAGRLLLFEEALTQAPPFQPRAAEEGAQVVRPLRWMVAASASLAAAAAAVFMLLPSEPEVRLKGGAVELLVVAAAEGESPRPLPRGVDVTRVPGFVSDSILPRRFTPPCSG